MGAQGHNLPARRTVLIGRATALTEGEQRLGTTRLLAWIGIGGSGKTRRALELAERLAPAFADGAWRVGLGALDDADQIAPAVANALVCSLNESRKARRVEV